MNSSCYQWGNTLDAYINDTTTYTGDSTNIAGFKWGEHYRLGLQFQYKTGKWSQPIFITDKKMDDSGQKPSMNAWAGDGYCYQNVPTFTATIPKSIGDLLLSKDYKRVRAVVCFPTESDQLILC
jgi:hypothetical protein